jgi:PAP2 superfamily protein
VPPARPSRRKGRRGAARQRSRGLHAHHTQAHRPGLGADPEASHLLSPRDAPRPHDAADGGGQRRRPRGRSAFGIRAVHGPGNHPSGSDHAARGTPAAAYGRQSDAHQFDQDVNAHLQGSSFAKSFFAPGKFIGQGATLIGTSFAVYGIGRAKGNDKLSHLGMDLLRATIEDGAIVYAIKLSVRRDRPTGECCSFPSGHASVTFAAASVLWRHLGWKAAVPTYTVASYVALSRLHDNRHYLSDVVFGSAVGVAVGHTVTMHTLRGHENWAISPMPVPGGGVGVMIARN